MKKLELSQPDRSKTMLHGIRGNDHDSMKVRRGVVKGYTDYLSENSMNTAREMAGKYGFEI
jgi:hypothetical protein